jgi:predicted O-methyltransferase YrrM
VDVNAIDNPFGGLANEQHAFQEYGNGLPMINQLHGLSYEIGQTWNKGDLDFVFVDADHSEWGVRKDIEAWKPHVKHGGFMMFHDYNHGMFQGVKKVVDELMAGDIRIAVVDMSALFMVK